MQIRKGLLAAAGVAAAAFTLIATAVPAFAQSGDQLQVYADTVTNRGCLQTNVFERGLDVLVWRVNVLENGQQDKNANVTVQVKGGQSFPAAYNKQDGFYTAAWHLTFGQATGTVQYTVTATDGSLTGTYSPQFMVAPSELMIVPATYGVAVKVGSSSAVPSFGAKSTVPVSARVTYPVTSNSKTTLAAVTTGSATAEIGLEGNVNAKGQQIARKVFSLHYSASAKAWTGSVSTSGLQPGIYVVQVNAKDAATPANTGTGTSLAFSVR